MLVAKGLLAARNGGGHEIDIWAWIAAVKRRTMVKHVEENMVAVLVSDICWQIRSVVSFLMSWSLRVRVGCTGQCS